MVPSNALEYVQLIGLPSIEFIEHLRMKVLFFFLREKVDHFIDINGCKLHEETGGRGRGVVKREIVKQW